jgi:hypothetical protein
MVASHNLCVAFHIAEIKKCIVTGRFVNVCMHSAHLCIFFVVKTIVATLKITDV